jgi:hypothetical protein
MLAFVLDTLVCWRFPCHAVLMIAISILELLY